MAEEASERKIDFQGIDKKWQQKWEKAKIFEVKEDSKKKKYYILEMFPYPSGEGLHMGHALNYTIGDVFARFKRMNRFNVLHPMGYDALGLPAENAAIKAKIHPGDYTNKAIANYIKQQKAIGLSYDWTRIVNTASPDYYKWDQWIFIKMFEKGLAYQKKAAVNFCSRCNSVLANEQVNNGKCWRHEDTNVEIKHLKQWFFKITDYADELYESLDKLDGWPSRTKAMQKNWIGKSYGTEIDFEINNPDNRIIFIHGKHGNLNKKSWYSWLKEKAKNKGIKIDMPQLPNADDPKINEWLTEIKKLNPDENTILIGHSRGAVAILRFLEQLKDNKKIRKVILISGRRGEGGSKIKSNGFYTQEGYNFNKIKKHCTNFVVIHSEDDPLVPFEDGKINSEKLGAEFIEFRDKGHFDIDVLEFPELLDEINNEKWPIFTTRPDTIYGVTFMVVSAQHLRLMELVTEKQKKEVEQFLKKVNSVSEKELEGMEKEGVFTGSYAINPVSNEKVPVYAGNFVVADYGCGMVMAVPAHDQRDFEFAKKYGIEIKQVIEGKITETRAYAGDGNLINSGKFNGLENKRAINDITGYLEKKKLGRKTINYKLRDWLISRQRYWGTPIPIIYCDKCSADKPILVPEKDLPVLLPEKVKFGKGNPLETAKNWIKVKCPKCGNSEAQRETDTMDTFVNSSWYYLRYTDSKNDKNIFDKKKVEYWCPIDHYIGGAEHACMHLIYIRFYTKFLRDLGLIKFDEPAVKLFHQGMLHGEGGIKMSKSKGNVISPDAVSRTYGMDTARLFLLSLAAPDKPRDWDEKGIQGSLRFVNKIFELFENVRVGESSKVVESRLNKTIMQVSEDIEKFDYNLAIIKIRKLFETISEQEQVSKKGLEDFLKMLSVFCPHIAEELWSKLGNKSFISLSDWPKADKSKIDEELEKTEQDVEKLKQDILNIIKIIENRGEKKEKVYVYVLPKELNIYKTNLELISKKTGLDITIFAVNDKNKYDPKGISKKSKPGKPGIYIE